MTKAKTEGAAAIEAVGQILNVGKRLDAAEIKLAKLEARLRKLEKLKTPKDEPSREFRARVLKAIGASK